MRTTIIFLIILLSLSVRLHGQTRTIYGRVIGEDLSPFADARIKLDTLLIGKTDIDGRFKINVPQNTRTLLIIGLGLEPATLKLKDNCDTIEIVMMSNDIYDFMSASKIDELRLKRFNKLPEIYLQAFNNGLFTKKTACYSRDFEPDKPSLDEIQKENIKIEKQIKLTFEKLRIGDTVRIPFSGEYRYDGTDRTTLSAWSALTEKKKFDYIIKGVIIGKNHKKGYNLIYKVTNCDLCKSPCVLNHKVVKVGEVFTHDMSYLKILNE